MMKRKRSKQGLYEILEEGLRGSQMSEPSKATAMEQALKPVAEEIKHRLADPLDESWNPEHHIEITLTVRECQAIIKSLEYAKGK